MSQLWYHGSCRPLTKSQLKFDNAKLYRGNAHGTDDGYGFYITTDRETAAAYGDHITAFTWQAKKPSREVANDRHQFTVNQLLTLIHSVHGEDDFGDVAYDGLQPVLQRAVKNYQESTDNDVDLINSLINATSDPVGVCRWLAHHGFDYSVSATYPNQRIVYNLACLKVVAASTVK